MARPITDVTSTAFGKGRNGGMQNPQVKKKRYKGIPLFVIKGLNKDLENFAQEQATL
jgi:hypothetical protein